MQFAREGIYIYSPVEMVKQEVVFFSYDWLSVVFYSSQLPTAVHSVSTKVTDP